MSAAGARPLTDITSVGRGSRLAGLLYEKEETCILCGEKFKVTKVRKSACPVLKRDADFCVYYQNENPNLYDVWVCPHCGYAAPESSWNELMEAQRKLVRDWLPTQPQLPDLSGPRTPDMAGTAYERAISCAVAKRGKDSQVAGLCLKAAWVYRVSGSDNDPREAEYVRRAAEHYEKAFQSEPTPIGTMTDTTIRYLIGELFRRCGRYKEACLYFSQLVSDPATRGDPRIGNMARDQWQIAKEQLKAQEAAAAETPATPQTARPASDEPATPATATAPMVAAPTAAATSPATTSASAAAPAIPAAAPAAASAAKPAAPAVARPRVTASVPLYTDQLAWAREVVRQSGGSAVLDTGAVLRAALEVAAAVDPAGLKVGSEAELKEKLIEAIRK